jgi:hypothetical protein
MYYNTILIKSHLWINKLNFFFIDYISKELEFEIDIEWYFKLNNIYYL